MAAACGARLHFAGTCAQQQACDASAAKAAATPCAPRSAGEGASCPYPHRLSHLQPELSCIVKAVAAAANRGAGPGMKVCVPWQHLMPASPFPLQAQPPRS